MESGPQTSRPRARSQIQVPPASGLQMFLVPLAAAAALDSFCDVAVPVLASSLEHGHEAVAMPAVMNEAKKSCTSTIIKFMLVQAASMLCLFAGRARQFTFSPRTPDDMTISPPSDFRHILHVQKTAYADVC